MATPPNPLDNELLAALPDAERQRGFPQLELITMPLGEVIYGVVDVDRTHVQTHCLGVLHVLVVAEKPPPA